VHFFPAASKQPPSLHIFSNAPSFSAKQHRLPLLKKTQIFLLLRFVFILVLQKDFDYEEFAELVSSVLPQLFGLSLFQL
jgi:hypothetical protein